MNGAAIIFYLLAALTLGSGVIAVTTRHIFRAAISLLFSLIAVAGIYFWLDYQFIAAVQIVVYVGGIVVLIIFSIFLTQQSGEKLPGQKIGRLLFSGLAAFSGFALTIVQILKYNFTGTSAAPVDPSVRSIGEELLALDKNGYALPFEVLSMLLLAAMISCIVIALRISPKKQLEAIKEDKKLPLPLENKLFIEQETGSIK